MISNQSPPASRRTKHAEWGVSFGTVARQFGTVLVRSLYPIVYGNTMYWAGTIAFYGLLSLFPMILLAVSFAAFVVEPESTIRQIEQLLDRFVPAGEYDVAAVIRETIALRGPVTVLSLLPLLWSGSRVFGAIMAALNVAANNAPPYTFFKQTVLEIAMLLTLGVLFFAAQTLPFVLNLLASVFNVFPFGAGNWGSVGAALVPALVLLLSFFLIYRFVPRPRPRGRAALGGAVIATLLVLMAQPIFVFWAERFGNFSLVYGSLAVVGIVMFWAWLVAVILLFGGEIALHTQALMNTHRAAHPAPHGDAQHPVAQPMLNYTPVHPTNAPPTRTRPDRGRADIGVCPSNNDHHRRH